MLNFPCDDLSINFTKTNNSQHSIAAISLFHFSLLILSFPSSFSPPLSVGEDARSYAVKNLMFFAILTYRFYRTFRARVTFKLGKIKLRMFDY